jgi:hypothetical protein
MPKAQAITTVTTQGETEQARTSLLSTLAKAFNEKKLADGIVIYIPDTGKAKFSGSHEYVVKSGKDKGETKMSKATFIVAEVGSSFAGQMVVDENDVPITMDNGSCERLPLFVKLSVTAQPPNRAGKTIDEALNRPGLKAVAA